jgi:tetratricopeptide (TPR) repeat protein
MIKHGTKSLDLGCGMKPKNPYNADEVFGIDVRDDIPANIRSADLVIEPIPFDDNIFDFVTAHDFLEHVPRLLYVPERRNAFVELMNEVYRVLKIGGFFLSYTPAYPHAPAFRDPTHVNIITDETFPLYFGDVNEPGQYRWASMYGFKGAFKITFQEWRGVNLLTIMKKVQPPEFEQPILEGIQTEANTLKQALELQHQGKIDEAIKLLWAAHIAAPGNAAPLYSLSKIALNYGNYAEAFRISAHGVLVDPLFIALRLIHGDSLQGMGRKEEALNSYNKALEINPNYSEVLLNSGILLRDMLLYNEALERFKHILTFDPTNVIALENCRLLTDIQ